MIVFLWAHNGARILGPLLPKSRSISLEERVSWTIAVNVLPSSRICEGQLARCDPDNLAVSIAKGLHLNVEVAMMQGQDVGETECRPELGAWEAT